LKPKIFPANLAAAASARKREIVGITGTSYLPIRYAVPLIPENLVASPKNIEKQNKGDSAKPILPIKLLAVFFLPM